MQSIVDKSIEAAKQKAAASPKALILKGILAGTMIALAGVGSQVLAAATEKNYLGAFIFPVGLILVVITGSELFTGDCVMVNGVLAKEITAKEMLKTWAYVYLGNLVGSLFVAFSVVCGGMSKMYGEKMRDVILSAAYLKTITPAHEIVVKGILCNILVCLAVLSAMKSATTIGKAVMCYFPVMLFVICGFEHSIANMYYLSAGVMLIDAVEIYSALWNLFLSTIGNIIGGTGVAALMYLASGWREDIRYNIIHGHEQQ